MRYIPVLCCLLLCCGILAVAQAEDNDPRTNDVIQNTDSLRQDLVKLLELNDPYYNKEIGLLGGFTNPHAIHTTLPIGTPVHRTRESAAYALSCLDSGVEWRRERAIQALEALLRLQDKDPASPTCGVWPWYYENPLAEMNPPDMNWADFLGVQLLKIAINHNKTLTAELQTQLREAIIRAAESIIRRDVSMAYTNIAIMGTYVTCIAGQCYNIPDLRNYGAERLRRFHKFTVETGGFPEYNSPTYTIIALAELARLRYDLKDPEGIRLVSQLYEMLWSDIATHYHQPTRQWAGPHSRSYSTLINPHAALFLTHSVPTEVLGYTTPANKQSKDNLYTTSDLLHAPAPCPDKFYDCFRGISAPRNHVQTFTKDSPPVVGYTRLTPAYTIGSVNQNIMWDQRRNVVGYWKSSESETSSTLHLRFLHDGYDFSSANVITAQQDGSLLAGINLATNGGDRHCNLDILKEGKVEASDLRLRLHLTNISESVELPQMDFDKPAVLKLEQVNLMMRIEKAAFGPHKPYCEVSRDDLSVYLDVVLYHGPKQVIDLNAIDQAYIVLALTMWAEDEPAPDTTPITVQIEERRLVARWAPREGRMLTVHMNQRPTPYSEIMQTAALNHIEQK